MVPSGNLNCACMQNKGKTFLTNIIGTQRVTLLGSTWLVDVVKMLKRRGRWPSNLYFPHTFCRFLASFEFSGALPASYATTRQDLQLTDVGAREHQSRRFASRFPFSPRNERRVTLRTRDRPERVCRHYRTLTLLPVTSLFGCSSVIVTSLEGCPDVPVLSRATQAAGSIVGP